MLVLRRCKQLLQLDHAVSLQTLRFFAAATAEHPSAAMQPYFHTSLMRSEADEIGIRRKLVTVLYKQSRPITSDEVWAEVQTLGARSKNHCKTVLQLMKKNSVVETMRMTTGLKEHRHRFGYQLTAKMRGKIDRVAQQKSRSHDAAETQ